MSQTMGSELQGGAALAGGHAGGGMLGSVPMVGSVPVPMRDDALWACQCHL